MSDETTLLPCPFCGGEAQMHFHRYLGPWYSVSAVHADRCPMDMKYPRSYATEAEAIAAWNTRAERTCEVVRSRFEDLVDEWCFELSCGHSAWTSDSEPPSYCPECGAKVIA